ncbi:GNAT family N-acetyltransferase [Bacillus sp. H-16]|uniref:GNAT family N-acetyltransferase n=1 Tax=Alteribacter salitolerans TaxID=2912333 RepID=UPI00196691A0|nr:GNAT family N-acetyltransferase [Alteribacter salitolerans]MBM7097873.1 GNAT family N-acetyltransferase [Alteribacter salitolerans]
MNVYQVPKNADTDTRVALMNLMMEQMNALGGPVTEEDLLKTIDLALTDHSGAEFFVAEHQGDIIGCAFFNIGISLEKGGRYIWLNDLYVKRDERQKGVAKRLLLKVLYWAEQEGLQGIELETGVNNAATKKLYNSLGFYDIISKRYGRTL